MEQKLKHLEFIQGVINRLATNSFQMKGWSVVLVAAILVLLVRENRLAVAYIALHPRLLGPRRLLPMARTPLPRPLRPRAQLGGRPDRLFHERRTVQNRLPPPLAWRYSVKDPRVLLRGIDRNCRLGGPGKGSLDRVGGHGVEIRRASTFGSKRRKERNGTPASMGRGSQDRVSQPERKPRQKLPTRCISWLGSGWPRRRSPCGQIHQVAAQQAVCGRRCGPASTEAIPSQRAK